MVSVERKGGTSDHGGLVRLALPRGLPSKQIQEARLRDKLRSIPSDDSEDRLTHGLTNTPLMDLSLLSMASAFRSAAPRWDIAEG